MMTYHRFLSLLFDISDCSTLEEYIAECGGSIPADLADEAVRLLTIIWTMGHDGLSIRSIADAIGTSMLAISRMLGISRRTLECWAAGTRNPPSWQLPLIAYAALSISCQDD